MKSSFCSRNARLLIAASVTLIALLPVLLQLLCGGIILGSDTTFHFSRFYDAYMQLKTGNLNFFQTNYGFYQSGRVINAVYGPLFAYVMGVILFICHSYLGLQLISSAICYLIAAFGMYYLAHKLHASLPCSLLLVVIYVNIGWVHRWQLTANMTAWGAAFAPFMILLGLRMISDHQRPIIWWQLALLMGTISQIHVLSTLLYILCLAAFALVAFIVNPARGALLKNGVLAVGATILLAGSFFAPYIELSVTNHLATPAGHNLVKRLAKIAIIHHYYVQEAIFSGVVAILIIQLVSLIFYRRLEAAMLTILAAVSIGITTIGLPWTVLQHFLPAAKYNFQFPARLLMIGYPLLLAGVAVTHSQLVGWLKHSYTAVLVITALQAVLICSLITYRSAKSQVIATNAAVGIVKSIASKKMVITAAHSRNLAKLYQVTLRGCPDYLATTKQYQHQSTYLTQLENKTVTSKKANRNFKKTVTGSRLVITWTAKTKKAITVPVNSYHNSVVTLNGKTLKNYSTNLVGAIKVIQHKGKNTLTITYHAATITTIIIIVSLMSWLGAVIVGCFILIFKRLL